MKEVKWPPLKGIGRASEKLMRSYSADVSRLLDVVRVAVVFDHAEELASFLDLVAEDDDVQIVFFQNRLRADYDAVHGGGYRDVHLNLVMQSPEAVRLGISSFVWELQLQLTPMAKLRTDGGHARYVAFRNMRAQ